MNAVSVIGIAASVFSAVSMLPQLITILREKRVSGISWFALSILIAGLGFWIVYGILKEDIILIVANSFSFLLNTTILIFAILYGKKKSK